MSNSVKRDTDLKPKYRFWYPWICFNKPDLVPVQAVAKPLLTKFGIYLLTVGDRLESCEIKMISMVYPDPDYLAI